MYNEQYNFKSYVSLATAESLQHFCDLFYPWSIFKYDSHERRVLTVQSPDVWDLNSILITRLTD